MSVPTPPRQAVRPTPPPEYSTCGAGNITHSNAACGPLLVTNDYGVVGGRDEESDDNYRYRIQQKPQGRNGANEAALRFNLLQVPGIQDIVFTRLAGTFNCYVYGIAPTPAPVSSQRRPADHQRQRSV